MLCQSLFQEFKDILKKRVVVVSKYSFLEENSIHDWKYFKEPLMSNFILVSLLLYISSKL